MMKIKQKITILIYLMVTRFRNYPVVTGILAGLTQKNLPPFLLSKLMRRDFRLCILIFALILWFFPLPSLAPLVGEGTAVRAFTNGALHSTILKKSYYVPCFAKATDFSNFAFEAQVTIVKGDEGGLIFRADDAASKFYYFRIGRDGFYGLNVSKDDKNRSR